VAEAAAAVPLLVVLGPTAAGKSALAVALAEGLDGEVVNADAFAVYRGMDIGTAKPSAEERARVPHHLVDVCGAEERSDLARWLALAEAAVADIHRRGRRVVVAGGSPLYTKALLEGLSAGPPRDEAVRGELDQRWEREGADALFAELARVDPAYAAAHHANDRRRVVRALEVHRLTGRPYSSFHTTDGVRRAGYRPLLLGLAWDKEVLHRRINARVRAMFAAGLVDEVRRLRPLLSPEALQAVGYKEVLALLDGGCDQDHAIYLVAKATRHLAKHQLTWYRRWHDIAWLPGDAPDLTARALALAQAHLGGKQSGA
jgi:tRNA dimethylallyltransferase